MPSNIESLKRRFDELAEQAKPLREQDPGNGFKEVPAQPFFTWVVSALNVVKAAFGSDSPHYQALEREVSKRTDTVSQDRLDIARGAFLAAKSDIDGGHIYDLERTVTGEVVGDFVALAKVTLAEGHHTVAAVLACAALEDALKRLAVRNQLNVDNKTMEDVINALKSVGLVSGPQKALLSAMPKVRNQAMHANWDSLTPQDAGSVIGFVEQFLLTHFQ